MRRLLALAAIYDGGIRSEAALLGDVTAQIVRDRVVRFNAEGPDGLIDRKAAGPKPLLRDAHRKALAALIDAGPSPAAHCVMRWRLCDLEQWLWEEFRVVVSLRTLSREVRAMGYRKRSARPKHLAQAEGAIEHFKRASLRHWRASRCYASTYISGAVCPQEGKGGALVLPFCNTAAMNLHLAEISAMVSPGRHAALLLDRAGWHLSGEVAIPDSMTLLPLPAKCPELNVMENVWQFMRENWLLNRVFRDHDDIVSQCCHHWNRLIDQPRRIMSIGMREWAHRFRSVGFSIVAGFILA